MSSPILDAIRKAAPIGLWSQGVKLARDGAVSLAKETSKEVELRVRERGRAVSPTVFLYLEDLEWDCDCGGRVSPCHHITAAVIAWSQGEVAAPEAAGAPNAAEPAPSRALPQVPTAHLRYVLRVEHGAFGIQRFIVSDKVAKLELSLADRIARRIEDPRIEPTHDDIAIDRLFPKRLAGDVALEHLKTALLALSTATDVRFGDAPAKTSGEPIYPEARVEDGPRGGVRLAIVMPRGLEIIAMGVGRVGGVLRPLAETSRFGHRFERLPVLRDVAPQELGTLVAEVLPELERTMVVDVRTSRLPRVEKRVPPRIEFELTHELGALYVMPLLVYGDPPRARVDAGKLVLLSPPAPVRDEVRERELTARLLDELSLVLGRRVRYEGREAAAIAQKLEIFRAREPGSVARGDASVRRELVPRIVSTGTTLDVVFELPESDEAASTGRTKSEPRRARAEDVAAAYREGLGVVALEGGGFAHLPADFLAKHGQAILDLVAAKDEKNQIPETAYPVLVDVADALGVDLPQIRAAVEPLLREHDTLPEVELPRTVDGLVRPYQRLGARWLSFLTRAGLGGVLADDMGLGKTLQVLSVLKSPALVVCPRSVVHNWVAETRRFRPDLRTAVYEGPNRRLDPTADVTLVTYATMRSDIDELSKLEWAVAILDEAQAIKNPDSQTARSAFRLKAKARFAMTGTPVENRLDDLWSILRFTNPGLLGPRRDFLDRYAAPIATAIGAEALDAASRLRRRIRPFVLRRTKGEVLPDLPPRTESILYCELTPEERNVYAAVLAATRKEVVERLGAGANVLAMLEALLRLRQAACHTGLLPGRAEPTSSKTQRLARVLGDAVGDGHKALVFSQWTSLLDKVEPALAEAGITFNRLDGSTVDRAGVVNAFQSPDGPKVMLLSLKAGGVGLNLTAADHVFLLDPWWNPAVEEQAADRAHRIGQDKPVMIYRLVAKDTVEERILDLQAKKRSLAASLVEGAAQAATLTREDLLSLLSDG
ncbi:MAG: DEAD/DEAH box helicase [Polyangiaceae bacterium]